MNTTDYFTYVNAMFLFCIFTCGLLVWAVIRGFNIKRDANEDLKKAHDRIKQYDMDIANETRKYDALFKQHIERGKRIIALEVAKDNAEKESRDLRKQLTESEKQANGYKAEFIAVSNELEATKAKVRKRDKDGKFLPSGNGRVRTPKKLKLVTDLGENEVIRCSTFKQAVELHNLDGRILIQHWNVYKKSTAFYPEACQYSSVQFYEENGYTIHQASDFIARPKRVKKVKSAVNELTHAFYQIKAAQPKLVHGLTVKNPTEDEAKMIFDEARRLGIESEASDGEVSQHSPWIWYCDGNDFMSGVTNCCDNERSFMKFVTAKDFVQRMQNGRG